MFRRSGYSAQTRSVRSGSGTEHHHVRADVLVGGGHRAWRQGHEAGRRALGGEGGSVGPSQAHDVSLRRAAPGAVDGLADALDHHLLALGAHGDRSTGVDRAVDLADVGQRRLRVLLVEGVERVGERGRDQAAGGEVGAGAAQEARPPRGAPEQLDGLHRDKHEREAPPEVEVTGVGARGLDVEAAGAGALPQRGKQLGVGVERDDLVSARGEVERHAAGAGAHVEHGPAGFCGKLAPQRQVLAVGAALDVVPQHGRPRGHENELPATPRATSTSRSASIAVYVGKANRRPSAPASARSRPWPSPGSTAIRSAGTPAYLRRTAISAARVPLHVAQRTRGARISKSASQTQLTSRPSAMLSLRTARTSCSPSSKTSVRSTSLAPAGFLTRRIARSRSPTRRVSARPNAGETPSSPPVTSSRLAPSASASAAAPSAL